MDLPDFELLVEAAVRKAMMDYHRGASKRGGHARRTRRDPRSVWHQGAGTRS